MEVNMNSYIKRLSLATAALTLAAVFVLPAVLQADEFNLKTYITVSHPFQVPGAVLEPNTKYVFRRLDSNAGMNHVIQVFNEDQSKLLSTFFAISDQRLDPAEDTILTFMEVAPEYPKPVQSWFYPGRTIGYEFVYPKEQKAEIAMHGPNSRTVATQTAAVSEPETRTTEPAPVAEPEIKNGDLEAEIEREKPSEPVVAEAPTPAPVVEEVPAAEPTMSESQNQGTPGETLPSTAGELPLIALLGLASLGLRQALRR